MLLSHRRCRWFACGGGDAKKPTPSHRSENPRENRSTPRNQRPPPRATQIPRSGRTSPGDARKSTAMAANRSGGTLEMFGIPYGKSQGSPRKTHPNGIPYLRCGTSQHLVLQRRSHQPRMCRSLRTRSTAAFSRDGAGGGFSPEVFPHLRTGQIDRLQGIQSPQTASRRRRFPIGRADSGSGSNHWRSRTRSHREKSTLDA